MDHSQKIRCARLLFTGLIAATLTSCSGSSSNGSNPNPGTGTSTGCYALGDVPATVEPAGFAIPSVADEAATYRALGWTWGAGAEPAMPAEPTFTVSDPDIHGDTEGDDLWTSLMMYRRSGQPGYLDRARAWARYFKEDFRNCIGSNFQNFCYDRDDFGADHVYGWGLVAWHSETNDPAALAEAEAIGGVIESLYEPNSSFGCLPTGACLFYGQRQVGRHLILLSRLVDASADARWRALLERVVQLVMDSPYWDDALGIYYSGSYGAADDRLVAPFQLGVLTEGLDHAYRVTGNPAIRERLVRIAEFVNQYGLDPDYQYAGATFGFLNGQPYHDYSATQPVTFWDPVYTTSLVNTLVRGYRYTCDRAFLDRAAYFFERGNKGIYGEPVNRSAPDGVVDHFVDSVLSTASGNFYYDFNKGELQYTYLLFLPENWQ